jgi:hypothetical protein
VDNDLAQLSVSNSSKNPDDEESSGDEDENFPTGISHEEGQAEFISIVSFKISIVRIKLF